MGKSSTDIRMLIVGTLNNDMGQHEVSRMLEIPRTTVRNVWKRFLETDTVDYKKEADVQVN